MAFVYSEDLDGLKVGLRRKTYGFIDTQRNATLYVHGMMTRGHCAYRLLFDEDKIVTVHKEYISTFHYGVSIVGKDYGNREYLELLVKDALQAEHECANKNITNEELPQLILNFDTRREKQNVNKTNKPQICSIRFIERLRKQNIVDTKRKKRSLFFAKLRKWFGG